MKKINKKKRNTVIWFAITIVVVLIAILKRAWIKETFFSSGPTKEEEQKNIETALLTTTVDDDKGLTNDQIYAKYFPMQFGSKGKYVKKMQEQLIKKYGNSILPKFGADGVWGTETAKALAEKGFPSKIDAATLDKMMIV